MKIQPRSIFHILALFAVMASLFGSALIVTPAYAAGISVNTVTDEDNTGAGCSLREAITAANNDSAYGGCPAGSGSDTITLPDGLFYTLSASFGQLPAVTSTIIINGTGSPTIQAAASKHTAGYRIFEVLGPDGNLTLNNLSLKNGDCSNSSICDSQADPGNKRGYGGAIINSGSLTLNNVFFTDNRSAGSGGAVFNYQGTLTVTGADFYSNTAPTGGGGGISISNGTVNVTSANFVTNSALSGGGIDTSGGTLNVTGSLFSTNTVSGDGGGINSNATLTVKTSSFHDNSASRGGGLANNARPASVSNSTFYNNSASSNGGGIFNYEDLTLLNNTFTLNSASGNGGAFYSDPYQFEISDARYAVVVLKNNILANSTSGRDCYNYVNGLNVPITGNNNLIELDGIGVNACGTTAPITSDPNLGTLTGFPLPQYYPLNPLSPAIDAGDNAACAASPVSNTSQNGIPRPQGPKCDIGSYELDYTSPSVTAFTATSPSLLNIPITSFTATDNVAVTGYLITTSSTKPAASDAGWTGTAPTAYAVASAGTYTLYPWAKDATGNVSAVFGSPVTVTAATALAIFADVPLDYWANSFITRLYNAGITGGCTTSPLNYCPTSPVTRAQMAIFLLKSKAFPASYTPPAVGASTGFSDVPIDYWAAAWVKQLAADGITSGCGPGIYCPDSTVTRAQMAVFLLKAKYGSAFAPSAPTGVFTDVPTNYWAAAWIERLASEGITSGCASGLYCPESSVTRDQMAVFIVKTFNLP